jgi:hypothetical protein
VYFLEPKCRFAHSNLWGFRMPDHQEQYWITCPECGHQMNVSKKEGPRRATYCEKCELLFYFTNEDLAVAESIGTGQPE